MSHSIPYRTGSQRSFLFLQGCTSPFFAHLGAALRNSGHSVYRINFNAGDACYWGWQPAWNFSQPVEELADFLEKKFTTIGFSDLIMLGDTRPVHRQAIPVAIRHEARLHILEEGYLRPNWLTLEEGGINGYSRLPRDPDWYREVSRSLPDYGQGEPVHNPLRLLALYEIGYHLPNLLNPLLFKGYRTHRPNISAVEFYGWSRRFAKMPYFQHRDNLAIQHLLRTGEPFYLLPLQLNSDSQIREHGNSRGIPFIVKKVVESFFRHAPVNTHLVIKNHPLDTGFIDYAAWIQRLQRRLKLDGRILYLESGHLPTLLEQTRGVVTVNSSVGTSALIHGCPTIALGKAIYDIPGLTFQGTLDRFWTQLEKPDRTLFSCFRNTVIHTTQVNGGFYSRAGIELGVANCCRRLEMTRSPLDELLAMIPPRSDFMTSSSAIRNTLQTINEAEATDQQHALSLQPK